jgi:hypothetical protein
MRGAPARVSRLTLRFVFLSFLSLLSWLAPAGVEAAGKRIGVPKFEGAQEALVRKKVMQALKAHGYELVRSRDMKDAMSSTGAGLDTDDGLKTLAKELALSAIVTGEVGSKRAKIVVHDGGEGSILGDASFGGANPRKLANEVGVTFWKKLGPDVGRGHVPTGAKKGQKASAAAPEDDESAGEGGEAAGGDSGGGEAAPSKPNDDSASAEGAGSDEGTSAKTKKKKPKIEDAPPEEAAAPAVPSGLPWLDFELGVGGLSRNLSYNQNVQINGVGALLRAYTLGAGPIGTANVVMYPLDPLYGGALGNIGLETEIMQGFAISSGAYSNVVHDFAGGGRYRFPFGGTNQFYVSATAGEDAFTFSGPNRGSLTVPDTIYHYFRPGVGVKLFVVGGFSMALSGGYRIVFNGAGPQLSGSPNGLFPHLAVAGADAEAVAGFRLSDMFEVRAGLEWRRYWFNMHSVAADANRANPAFAGGALDQSFAFTARIAILLGGKSAPKAEGAAGDGAEEAPPPPPPPKSRSRKKSSDDEGTSGGDSDTASPTVKSGGDTDQ